MMLIIFSAWAEIFSFEYFSLKVFNALTEKKSQFLKIFDIIFDKSFFLVKSTINPFFPLTIISFAPSVFVQIIGVPSLKDSMFTIPKLLIYLRICLQSISKILLQHRYLVYS